MTNPDTRPSTGGPDPAHARFRGDRSEYRLSVATPAASPDKPHRVIRDCLHPQVHHEHGTRTAYVFDRCRCSACTTANRLEAQKRRKDIAYGRWTPLVPAEAARQHLQHLRAHGLSLNRIAALSGVGYGTIARLIYGDPSRCQPPTARLRHHTQLQLLNIQADDEITIPGCRVEAAGSRRRVQALVAAGWPLPTLAQRLDRRPGNLRRTMTANTVTAEGARRITKLYGELSNRPPPNSTNLERADGARARTEAAQSGWLPPWAWDDIDHDNDEQDIDDTQGGDNESWFDEIAIEQSMRGEAVRLTRQERDEAIFRLTKRGVSASHIAALLGTTSRHVVRRRAARRLDGVSAQRSIGPPVGVGSAIPHDHLGSHLRSERSPAL